jgi:hypothetical protein
MPYIDGLFLGVSATKRVWAKRVPAVNSKMPRRVTGYVMSPGRPAVMVPVQRSESQWEFGGGYAAVQAESAFALPNTLEDAIRQRDFDSTNGWWSGLPELTTLFKFVAPRTVFEGDEAALLDTVSEILGYVLVRRTIGMREVPVSRKKQPVQEMLRLADLEFGTAGDLMVSDTEVDDQEADDEAGEPRDAERLRSIAHYREQNIRALRLSHGEKKPLLWVLCSSMREREIISTSAQTLFGDAVDVKIEPLPAGTHGLRAELDGADFNARGRFEKRIEHWEKATGLIREISAGRPIIALICAADKYNQRSEDSVNYYAGIHAMSKIGANVHHVLPIESPGDAASEQAFLHRTQSALLDVFLAHSGIIFGTREFAAQLITPERMPRCVYGLQALRSRARARSGQTGVTFLLYTRLVIESGITEVQFVYKGSGGTQRSPWKPLSEGLQWLGSQRQMQGDDRWLKAAFEDATRETLSSIQAEDPRAIVMVDWQSVTGLWRGLRDRDLRPGGAVSLGNVNLAAFKDMTFVRLRRGADTLSLRSEVKVTYEGWRNGDERVRSGEIFIDGYYTTGKSLVEISDDGTNADQPYGHFIATMGYAKTVQVKRGFSCYRSTPRMQKVKGAKEYELKMLEPANMDASLPASMEITVLTSPAGVHARDVAMLALGLRIGYAHYNDWTTLPAPLFFRRKIEDYVIRFPDDDEENESSAGNDALPPDVDVIDDGTIRPESQTFVSRLVEEAGRPDEPVRQGEIELPEIGRATDDDTDELDLLSRVKATRMPPLHTSLDHRIRSLGQRMMQQDTNVRVRVELPYWLKTKNIFGEFNPTIRRNAKKCWRDFRDLNLVKDKTAMPRESEFLNWMAGHLQVPQAALALVPACGQIGGLSFKPLDELVRTLYNPGRPTEEQVNVAALDPGALALLTKWANEQQHDELMAWLVFQVSQFPKTGWCVSVFNNMVNIPGPMTEEALKYYLDVVSAINDALAQRDHVSKFQTIVRRRPKPIEPLHAAPPAEPETAESAFALDESQAESGNPALAVVNRLEEEPVRTMIQSSATPPVDLAAAVAKTDPAVMSVAVPETETAAFAQRKAQLSELVNDLVAGSPHFPDVVAEINAGMEALLVMHRRELDRASAVERDIQREAALRERCSDVLAKIKLVEVELGLGNVKALSDKPLDMDVAEDNVVRVEAILGDIEALQAQMKKIDSLPRTVVLAERQKRSRIVNETLESMTQSAGELRELLAHSPWFEIDGDANPVSQTEDEAATEDLSEAAAVIDHILHPSDESIAGAVAQGSTDNEEGTVGSMSTATEDPDRPPHAASDPDALVQELPEVADFELIGTTGSTGSTGSRPELETSEEAAAVKGATTTRIPGSLVDMDGNGDTMGLSYAEGTVVSEEAVIRTLDPSLEEDEYLEGESEVIDHYAGELLKLVAGRLYGLASVHVEAMKPLVAEVSPGEVNAHGIVLHALIESLERMDCQFEFDAKLHPALKDMLMTQTLSGGSLTDNMPMALGVLAAGLSSMLFDNSDAQWNIGNAISTPLTGQPGLKALIEHIDTIRQRGLVLTRDMFRVSKVGDQEALKQELRRFQARAADWKTGPDLYSSWAHRGFKAMHEELFSPKNLIGACIEHIARGDAGKVASAFEEARRKFEKPAVTLDEVYRKVGEKSRPDGLYRVRAIENIEATRSFVESYLDHVRRKENPNVELVKSTLAFLSTLHVRLDESLLEITGITPQNNMEKVYCDAAASAVRCALRLYDESQTPACISQDKQKLLIQAPLNHDLMPVLKAIDEFTPPLCTPLAILEETSRWANENLSPVDGGEHIDDALKEALRLHLAAGRYVPAFCIESHLPRAAFSGDEPPVHQLYNQRKASFDSELQRARQRVTHALTLSALAQNEANSMERVIEGMLDCLRPDKGIGHPAGEGVAYADFPQAAAVLRYRVLMPLESRLADRAKRLEDDLNSYAEENRGIASPRDIARIREMLKSENAANLRTAHDALALLKINHKLPGRLGGPTDLATHYDRFMSDVHESVKSNKTPLDALCAALEAPESDDDPVWMRELTSEDRDDAAKLIRAWTELFVARQRVVSGDNNRLEAVFQLLGINHEPSPSPEHGRPNRLRFMLPERSFTFPTTADDEMFIPPILGSRAVHIQGFMMFGQSSENDLRQLMLEIAGTPTVVLARTRLNVQKRTRVCGNAPVLLIDDELVAYVALHPNERLQALLRVAMLNFGTNPYDDYGGRPVPSEMFFGRQHELARLRDLKSIGVLYGGRRLGKSSLLAQVEVEARTTPGMTAVYISMDTIDSTTDHVLAAWGFVYRNLLWRKIVEAMPRQAVSWQQIRDWLEKELTGKTDLKSIYLLIDEADSLMGRELRLGKGEIGFVRGLQQMVENLAHICHIRYVIAGLHNMTRMTSEENSVLGKADPIALEPFSASDVQRGIRLITKPLAAMGFLFDKDGEDLPLRILSVCNFYPAFIQLYCKNLVDRLMNRRQETRPPLYITVEDLDKVEHDTTLLSELRNKFELNLNLDKRYKAIALLLADVYYSQSASGQYVGLTISEISELCELMVPTHFASAGPGVYEALLEEMIKLNVLERTGTRYVLRNPNIAMMMGDVERVSHKLDVLAKEPPEDARNRGERRIAMDHGTLSTPFPFPVAWVRRYMDASDGELLILTGNDLSGILELSKSGREEWNIGQNDVYMMMPGSGPQAAAEYLGMLRRDKTGNKVHRIVAVRQTSWSIQQIPAFVAAAQKAAKQGIHVRFVLLAMPERAFELAEAASAGRIEPTGWRVVPVPQWTEDAVYFRIQENAEVSESSAALSAIIEASCGFEREVIRICGSKMSLKDALKAPEIAAGNLGAGLDEFYKRLNLPASFADDRRAAVNRFLEAIDGALRSSTEVEEIRDLVGVTPAEIDFVHWMGMLQEGPAGTWHVPRLYKNLISG